MAGINEHRFVAIVRKTDCDPLTAPGARPEGRPVRSRKSLGRKFRWFWVMLVGSMSIFVGRAVAAEATLVADAHVNSARPGVNSGAISNLNVGGGYTALLQFDLSTLPAGTTAGQVSRAVLRMYCNRMDTAGLVSVQPVGGAWGEYSVTYATLPSLGSAAQVFSVSQAGTYIAVDVTALVQGWISTPATNQGIALTAGTAVVQFDSKENDLTGHAAMLDVSLASAGPQGPTGATGSVGPIGPAGPAGAQGPQGIQGVAGAPGLSFQGQYAAAVAYALHDVVTYSGSSYVSLTGGNLGNTPGLTPQWAVLAQAGLNGSSSGGTGGGSSGGGGGTTVTGVNYRGAYASTTNYALDDVVTYQGSSYISLIAGNHGNTPALSPTEWGVLALGAVGVQGPTGPAGSVGPQGLTGPAGATGLQGPTGATGAAGAPGLPGLVYQGAYSSVENYALGDVVLWQGSSYASLQNSNHGNTPSLSPNEWGVLTAQGPTGATGLQGPQGVAGPQGATGSVGPPGQTGAQGAQGIPGQAGTQGLTGPAGATGASGPAGPQGPAGPVGMTFQGTYSPVTNYAVGDGVTYGGAGYVSLVASNHGNTPDTSPAQWGMFATGTTGAQGAAGPAGQQGVAGATGPQGAVGPAGPQGATGSQGPAVANYTGSYVSSTNYGPHDAVSYQGSTYVSLVAGNLGNTPSLSPTQWAVLAAQGVAGPTGPAGPAGTAGTAGATGATGAVGPQGPPVSFAGGWLIGTTYPVGGAVSFGGSSYIALVANVGREPDVSPTYWAVLAQAGSAGPAGPAGATGAQGPTGFAGPQGVQGPQGTTGATGAGGPAGVTGPQGPTGATGAAGVAGPAGMVYRGSYASSTNYGLNDAVSYMGSSYISVAASNQGNLPNGSASFWSLLAAQGATGSTGATGAQGVAGAQGIQGVTGPAGPAGAVGVTYRGAWSTSTAYHANDVVAYAGTTYLATVNSTGSEPDTSPTVWAVLAQNGATGASGPAGAGATVTVGSVTTGAAGTQATVTNSGSVSAAVLNFTIPQGAAGTNGTGSGGGSGISFASAYHAVSFSALFYSVNSANSASTETDSVLTWVPTGCTATELSVFSHQSSTVTVSLRQGAPGSMAETALVCSVASGTTCTVSGSVTIPAGAFVDLNVTGASGTAAGVWTALACD
jgi:Collagen triple helix repeat (20 copies)